MSDQEHERPLTRRELRLREQAESAGAESIDEAIASDPGVPAEQAPATDAAQSADIEVEIDPLNPDGTPRTRREMRELRAAAVAELLAARGGDAESPADEAASAEDDSYGAPTEALSFEDLPVNGDSLPADDAEIVLDAPTEAFTLEDILDAAEPKAPTGDAEAVAQLFGADDAPAGVPDAAEDATEVDEAPAADLESDALEIDDLDADSGEADQSEAAQQVDAVDAELLAEDLAASAVDGESSAPAAGADFVVDAAGEAVDGEDVAEAAAERASDSDASDTPVGDEAFVDADEEDTSRDTAGYSFPDIKPPEEWRSVFDDPSRAASITAPGESGDFDDLISRAVAQEGSTGGTGASALILPSHPGDTGGLTGPLGATGELFVTGSIELPKSMGETGGHSGIHDSIDYDPFLTGDNTESIAASAESGPMPVSALSAVSARRRPEVPVVAEPTKDRSKMPLILALSGGGLIVLVVGGVVYAASQGLFG